MSVRGVYEASELWSAQEMAFSFAPLPGEMRLMVLKT